MEVPAFFVPMVMLNNLMIFRILHQFQILNIMMLVFLVILTAKLAASLQIDAHPALMK